MTVVTPEGIPTLGATKLKAVVVTVPDQTAPKLATEINAATSRELTGYLYADGYTPSGSQGKGQRRRRIGATTTKEALNVAQWTSPTLQYVHDPSLPDAGAGNEARNLLQEGVVVTIVERRGPDADVAFAVGNRVRCHKVRMGRPFEMDSPDENGEFYILQETEYVGEGPVNGVVVT